MGCCCFQLASVQGCRKGCAAYPASCVDRSGKCRTIDRPFRSPGCSPGCDAGCPAWYPPSTLCVFGAATASVRAFRDAGQRLASLRVQHAELASSQPKHCLYEPRCTSDQSPREDDAAAVSDASDELKLNPSLEIEAAAGPRAQAPSHTKPCLPRHTCKGTQAPLRF